MVFRPVFNLVLLGIVALLAGFFIVLSARRSTRRHVMDVLRRSLILFTVIIMGAGPSILILKIFHKPSSLFLCNFLKIFRHFLLDKLHAPR